MKKLCRSITVTDTASQRIKCACQEPAVGFRQFWRAVRTSDESPSLRDPVGPLRCDHLDPKHSGVQLDQRVGILAGHNARLRFSPQ